MSQPSRAEMIIAFHYLRCLKDTSDGITISNMDNMIATEYWKMNGCNRLKAAQAAIAVLSEMYGYDYHTALVHADKVVEKVHAMIVAGEV